MPITSWPRISQARDLLPLVRAHLVAAAAHSSLPAGVSLELMPIVEDGLIGYEFLPNQAKNIYLTIGCDGSGAPVLRESSYRTLPQSVLRLASVNGRALPRDGIAAGLRLQQHDTVFRDWSLTSEAAWRGLAALFPEEPRHAIEVRGAWHECLDCALAIADAHLAGCDPCIDFCGVPNEAQYGFALTEVGGGRGRLTSRRPGTWVLWFQSAEITLNEEWSVSLPGIDVAAAWVSAGATPLRDDVAVAAATPLRRSGHRAGGRVDTDRRRADRRHANDAARGRDERRHRDRRRTG